MKFSEKVYPNYNDRKLVKRFAFLPVKTDARDENGRRLWVWCENYNRIFRWDTPWTNILEGGWWETEWTFPIGYKPNDAIAILIPSEILEKM